uniref:ADP,ATP carrier protein n=1 Tax=Pyramimonas obovata TaxID=1411642 RepID=A0A6T7Z6I2_9CHLO|mmetsp:Transcript_778/g.1635  ORF Transcript_778/g.1635 Transcript_778/m.1635 type:complete len:325 (+) Transcript_778:371-1345(+)|eukprot:CAMPEP_0118927362 /NCGR_PEP_ID=MMETSP1169-20130426/4847_1 /TAXON_ID=36882 /ORGANISM="Pyramimonas obovata, Strain CCMP722" /LENGTH=324 /DNA_ID=CAMNT_0006869109 /DNA_START=371 /DNA_END=1345 /DNA_ORIENTATION=-
MPLPALLIEAASGAVGAMFALTVSYPLMTVNTRQQTTQHRKDGEPTFAGPLDTALEIIAEEGSVLGLFKGLQASLIGTGVSQLLYFCVYAAMRTAVIKRRSKTGKIRKGEERSLSGLEGLAIASLSGAINVVVTSPIWVVATRMQACRKSEIPCIESASGKHAGLLETCMAVYKDYGVMGYWKGVLPSLAMVSNPAIQYMIYEWCRTYHLKVTRSSHIPPVRTFMMGAAGKLGATLVTYPMLMIKSRLQAQSTTTEYQYNGLFDAIYRVYQAEGIGSFYEGMRTKMVQSVFASALMFTLKEEIDRAVRKALQGGSSKKPKVATS